MNAVKNFIIDTVRVVTVRLQVLVLLFTLLIFNSYYSLWRLKLWKFDYDGVRPIDLSLRQLKIVGSHLASKVKKKNQWRDNSEERKAEKGLQKKMESAHTKLVKLREMQRAESVESLLRQWLGSSSVLRIYICSR